MLSGMKFRPSQVLWGILQLVIGGACLYSTGVAFMEGAPPAAVIFGIVASFFVPIALTVLWVLIYEFFRFTLPAGIARAFRFARGRRTADVDKPQSEDRRLAHGGRGEILENLRPLRTREHRG
jgi:hypothetical protein